MKFTPKNIFTSFLLSFILLSCSTAGAQTNNTQGKAQNFDLQTCKNEKYQLEYLCDPSWEVAEGENSVFIIISSEPAITVTILKAESPFAVLGQISHEVLKGWEQYADGFKKDEGQFAGQNAIIIKAFSSEFPEVRLLDYYVIHDSFLYNVLFSINPKTEWDNYKFLIKQISDSFQFIK